MRTSDTLVVSRSLGAMQRLSNQVSVETDWYENGTVEAGDSFPISAKLHSMVQTEA
jgi:hypothetical protein